MFSGASIRLSDVYDWEIPQCAANSAVSPKFDLLDNTNPSETTSDQAEAEPVTVYNMEQYVLRTLTYCLDKGIRKQIDAFRGLFICICNFCFVILGWTVDVFVLLAEQKLSG